MFDKLNLVETILRHAEFSILTRVIGVSGLANILKSKGPFTILAPTDAAFNKLPPETLTNLLKPENKETLGNLVEYHIIPGKLMAADIQKLMTAKTVQGQEVKINTFNDIKINGARLQVRNIEAMNGVIHAIDTVLVLAQTAQAV
ncbi:MAG TPA: fasciclin domain-containing protein [Pyrinomonadaceae bacterium]|jgi:uncharacterized surface protein with fasciclin (FAS1) repeats